MFKKIARELLPPLFHRLIEKSTNRNVEFESFKDALTTCQAGAYQNDYLTQVVVKKNLIFRENLEVDSCFDLASLRTLIALGAMRSGNNLNVIDFGGGGGMHYAIAKKALGSTKSIRWNVVETLAMSDEAQVLANSELKFFSELSKAVSNLDNIDLVFSSSALQYCEDPLLSLRELVDLNASYLFITRTPFLINYKTIVTTQVSKLSSNGPGYLPRNFKDVNITYPVTYVSKEIVEAIISKKYDIRFKIDEGNESFNFKDEPISVTGYFCVRKQS